MLIYYHDLLNHVLNYLEQYKKYFLLKYIILFSVVFFQKGLQAQQIDSTQTFKEIVITATRHETDASKVSLPIQIITQKAIQQSGSMRLGDILAEQTGIHITQDHTQGVQIQGLSADYTLILLNGEPLIGRTAGSLDLGRLSLGNIKRIEIIKGASSAMYGSEALAGVINIITEDNSNTKNLTLNTRYGNNQISNTALNSAFNVKNFQMQNFINHYRNGGYDFSPEIFGATVEPHFNTTFHTNIKYTKNQWEIKAQARIFGETQQQGFLLNPQQITGKGTTQDQNYSTNIVFGNQKKTFKIHAKSYFSRYNTLSNLYNEQDKTLYENTFFTQTFLRPELQAEYFAFKNHYFVVGVGNTWESVEATRYTEKKRFQNQYAYFQHEWDMSKNLQINWGMRFDAHSSYKSQLSPKMAVLYKVNPKISLRGSVGMGFKAPDFRQLYLDFANSVVGYSVFGTEELQNALANMQTQGQIAEVFVNTTQTEKLNPERSTSWQAGGNAQIYKNWQVKFNFFYNQISDLIETQAVARKINGQFVYSYKNIQRIFSKGLEIEQDFTFFKNIKFSLGYQFLLAKDNDIVQKIKNGEIYRRNPQTLLTEKVKLQEYGGLFNRSKHSANFKIWYENAKHDVDIAIRIFYKGRYGLGDMNGNLVLDIDEEYVKGYFLANIALKKTFFQKYSLQIGCDNVLDYKNETQIPNIAGRLYFVACQVKIF